MLRSLAGAIAIRPFAAKSEPGDRRASDDEALFERVRRADDHAAFGMLVDRYRSRVLALARRMVGAGIDADDIAQEAFVEAYHKRATFRGGGVFRPWLYRIAVNRCLDRLRSRRRAEALPWQPSDENIACPGPNAPLADLIRREDLARLEQAVAALPPKLRAVFILRYVDDLPYEEIASACDLPLGTVKTLLFRARAELRERCSDAD